MVIRVALVGAALAASVAAQAPGPSVRQWITGKVMRADGRPWPDAAVQLHSLSWRTPPSAEFLDHVTVTTNAAGRFRAQVLPGRDYDVWCTSPVVDDRYTTTDVVAGASAGTPVELREAARENVAVAVQLHGHAEWAARGPLTAEVFCMLTNRLDVPCGALADGRVALPPVPQAITFFRVRDRDGIDIGSGRIPLRSDLRDAQLAGGAPDPNPDNMSRQFARFVTKGRHETEVHLPPPVPFDVVVRCDGKAAANVLLTWSDRCDHRPWGKTDADGVARLFVPAAWGKAGEGFLRYLSLYAQGPGVATVHAYASDLDARASDKGPGRWEVGLPAGTTLRGRLWWRDGRPAAGVPVLVHTGLPRGVGGRGASYGGSPLCHRTDGEGRFVVPGRVGYLGFQLSTFLGESHLRELPPSPVPYAPAIVLAAGDDANAGGDQDLGDLVLATMAPIDITVVDERDQPVPGQELAYREALAAEHQEERVCYARADWQGRIRLLARPGVGFLVATKRPDDKGRPEAVVPEAGKVTSLQLRVPRQ